MEDTPQYRVEVDREKARALSLSLDAVNRTLSTAWGSAYVNDYIENGRIKKGYVQGDARFRMQPSDLGRWCGRNENGQMVPFASFASGVWNYGSHRLARDNCEPALNLHGEARPGLTVGEGRAPTTP